LTLSQNLKGVMSEALLSRFDVIFLMRNQDQQSHDAALSRHIVNRRMPGVAGDVEGLAPAEDRFMTREAEMDRTELKVRLAKAGKDSALPPELLQTYLRYAKHYAQPCLGKAAKARIKEFYMEKKNAAQSGGSLPVTPRQLEALIRLSEARAKAELRRVVLASDVEDVIEILRSGSDFQEEFSTVTVRKGTSKSNVVMNKLVQYMTRRVKIGAGNEFREAELKEKCGQGVEPKEWNKAWHVLNDNGTLLLNQSGFYVFNGA